jgi:hypothetical protein
MPPTSRIAINSPAPRFQFCKGAPEIAGREDCALLTLSVAAPDETVIKLFETHLAFSFNFAFNSPRFFSKRSRYGLGGGFAKLGHIGSAKLFRLSVCSTDARVEGRFGHSVAAADLSRSRMT